MKQLTGREQILKSARKLFIQNGFAGTSTFKIAELAEVSHALVFHHFKTKKDLWVAVKADIVKKSNEKSPIIIDTNLPFDEFLAKLIQTSINFYRNNTDIIRMINWQRLEGRLNSKVKIPLSSEVKLWINAFEHYKILGVINSAIKSEFIVNLVLSIASSAALDKTALIKNDQELDEYINFCTTNIFKILRMC